ncbi:hypothetical protein [Aestuariivirga sp.]|uniref:hypothetical protein n=1 Tax=Aestuariivirga sp. TaxID=2650926 RepID=UPI0039E40001
MAGQTRHYALLYGASYVNGAAGYDAAHVLQQALDGFAEHLTGDKQFFWSKPHTAGG